MQFTGHATAVALLIALSVPAVAVERVERGNLVMEDVPALSAPLAEKLDRYLHSRQATVRDWTPEGALIISTRFGEVEQLHLVDQPLGTRRQLTFFDEPIGAASHSPSGGRAGFVFLKDEDGNENAQIYFQPLALGRITGEPRLVTDGVSLNGSVCWSNDGKRIAFYSNLRSPFSYDIYVVDPASGEPPRMLVESRGNAWYSLDWSPDDTKLLLWNVASINDSTLWVADLTTGQMMQVDRAREAVGISTAAFSRDGQGVYLVADRGSEFKRLRYVPLRGGGGRVLTGHIRWDIEEFEQSRDGRYLAYIANVDGVSRLNLLDLVSGTDLVPPQLPAGTINNLRFDPSSRRLAFGLETAGAPRDVFVYDLEKSLLTRWTQSEVGPLDETKFADAELIRYPTFDPLPEDASRAMRGHVPARVRMREIPAFVYRPSTPGPHPVLINIHGGPEAQYRPGFDAFLQFAVAELGYVVIAPNVRGSDGYGKTYLSLDNGYRREDSVKDIGELLTWIGKQAKLDRKRVVVMGGSYGGYMTLASLARYSDRLSGGIDTVGISNYLTFLTNTSEYRRDLRRAEYGDERDERMREFLERISPLTNAEQIRRPLLVVQGLNDPRVPASESEQMVARIRAQGGSVWYLLAKDEGHGFRKKQNRDAYWRAMGSFLDRLAVPGGDSGQAADEVPKGQLQQ
jgi:dipeptidyl aminopeptidase/acylaminoacyl peptidase